MICSDARHLIHLDVGDDLRAEEQQQLAGHMSHCSDCRAYHASMSSSMTALLTLRDDPAIGETDHVEKSVWPAVSREIARRSTTPKIVRKFNLQVVALSVCSLSLAMVTIVQSLSAMRDFDQSSGYVPAQSVSNPGPVNWVPPTSRFPDASVSDDAKTPILPGLSSESGQSF